MPDIVRGWLLRNGYNFNRETQEKVVAKIISSYEELCGINENISPQEYISAMEYVAFMS